MIFFKQSKEPLYNFSLDRVDICRRSFVTSTGTYIMHDIISAIIPEVKWIKEGGREVEEVRWDLVRS